MSVTQKEIRILVVDDSAFMRKAITMMLESDPGIKVIGGARDGQEGAQMTADLKPDIVTMDIEMPRMDGVTALKKIMRETPTPVLMISSLTTEGAKATLDAMENGAVDFIPKQLSYVSLDISKIKEDLLAKIKHIYSRRRTLMAQHAFRRLRNAQKAASDSAGAVRDSSGLKLSRRNLNIVAMGVSTGGPPALQTVIPGLPASFPTAVLVVQHMPPMFTKSLAERLDSLSQIKVKEAEHGEPIVAGCVYIAPGDKHLKIRKWGVNTEVRLDDEPSTTLHRPSVDVMMDSVADAYGGACLGVIMTGMGCDGVNGIRKMKEAGGRVIAQNEQTSVVYGMPKAIVDAGLADKVSPLENIAADIISYFR